MFNARYKKDRQVYQILDTSIDSLLGITMFLVWYQNEWRWLFASDFYPPNVEIKEINTGQSKLNLLWVCLSHPLLSQVCKDLSGDREN